MRLTLPPLSTVSRTLVRCSVLSDAEVEPLWPWPVCVPVWPVVCPCCVPLWPFCWAPFWSCFCVSDWPDFWPFCVSDWPDFGCAESRFIWLGLVWPRSPPLGWLLVPRSIWPPPRSVCVPWPVVERSPAPPLAPPFGPPLSIVSAGAVDGAPPAPAPPGPPAPPVPPCIPWAETAIVPAARAAAATVANNVFLMSVPPCRPRVTPQVAQQRRGAASVPGDACMGTYVRRWGPIPDGLRLAPFGTLRRNATHLPRGAWSAVRHIQEGFEDVADAMHNAADAHASIACWQYRARRWITPAECRYGLWGVVAPAFVST